MEFQIIKTNNYLIIVDNTEIKVGDWVLFNNNEQNKIFQVEIIDSLLDDYNILSTENIRYSNFNCLKIVAHLPLNNSIILNNTALLPPIDFEISNIPTIFVPEIEPLYKWIGVSPDIKGSGIRLKNINSGKIKTKINKEKQIELIGNYGNV
jgi:hypothetical protein